MVEAVERRSHVQNVAGDDRGLVVAESHADALLILGQSHAQSLLHGIGQGDGLGQSNTGGGCLFQNGAGAGVGVLHVGARVAVEGQSVLHVEVDVLDAVVGEIVEHDGAHAHGLGDIGSSLQIGVLLLHDLGDLLNGGGEQILQKHHVTRSGSQLGAVDRHRTVGHVNQPLVPVVAHQLHHLEPLLEVEDLLIGGDVDALVEIVHLLAIHRRGNVTGGIQGGAVTLEDQAGRHTVLREIHDGRAVIQLEQTAVAELLHLSGHEIGVSRLTLVAVKGDPQLLEGHVVGLHGLFNKPTPQSQILLVPLLHFAELSAGLVSQRGILRDGVVDADVEIHQSVHAALFNGLAVAPLLVGHHHLTELGTPVAEVVDTHALVARELVKHFQSVTDDGRTQVTDVEGLGQIGRAVVQHHRLSLANIRRTVALLLGQNLGHQLVCQICARQVNIQISVDRLCLLNGLTAHQRGEGRRDLHGGAAQGLGQLEAGQSNVAHSGIGGVFQKPQHVLGGHVALGGDGLHTLQNAVGDQSLDLKHHSDFFLSKVSWYPKISATKGYGYRN